MGTPQASLKRGLSLPLVTFYGLGTILGAGIYALVGKVADRAGMLTPLSFLLAFGLAAFTALSYAELSSRFPRSAGEAVYVHRAFARRWLTLGVGMMVVLTGVVSSAAIANAFAGYLDVLVALPDWLVIAILIIALGGLAAWGINESLTAAMVIALVEIGGLLLVVWAARHGMTQLPQRAAELVPADLGAWQGVWLGAFLAFYAFIGFEDMVNVVEEIRDPGRTLPRAIFLALGAAAVLYVLVALAAVAALPVDELAASDAPLVDVYLAGTGTNPLVITVISLFAVSNGVLVQIIMGSRVLYGLSGGGWLPEILGRVHPATRTPIVSTALVTGTVLVLALAFPLVGLAEATTFIILIVFALVNLALWLVKRRDPRPAGVRVYPRWIPLAGFVVSAGFAAYKLASLVTRS